MATTILQRQVINSSLLLLLLVLSTGSGMIVLFVQDYFRTLVLFLIVIFAGLFFSQYFVNKLDKRLIFLPSLWLVKAFILLVSLRAGWIPDLFEVNSPSWGYDPQRYYFQAKDLIDNGWIFFEGLNYVGILYFYGIIFYFFGHNPFAPALINSWLSFLAVLMLLRLVYRIFPSTKFGGWKYALLLVVPEVLWFDVMTSRESIVQFLIILAVVQFVNWLFFSKSLLKSSVNVLQLVIALAALSFIRTSMILPVIIIFILIFFIHSKKLFFFRILILLFLATCTTLFFSYVNERLGISSFDIGTSLSEISNSENNVAGYVMEYGNNSISQLLFPSNWIEAVVFVPFRVALYLISPLPNIDISILGLIHGESFSYHSLFIVPSSILNIYFFPSILALTVNSLSDRKGMRYFLLLIPFWVVLLSVAGGNLIIHERYRLMCSLLLVTCGLVASEQLSREMLMKYRIVSFFVLFIFTLFYIVYKFL